MLFPSCFVKLYCTSVCWCRVVTWERADLWLSLVMSNSDIVTFPMVSWVRCGAWLYRFLVFALFLTMRFLAMWYVQPAEPQISLHTGAVRLEPLLVAWIIYDCLATDWTPFGVSNHKGGLHRLVWVWVYTYPNVTLLEIKCHSSIVHYKSNYCPHINTEINHTYDHWLDGIVC